MRILKCYLANNSNGRFVTTKEASARTDTWTCASCDCTLILHSSETNGKRTARTVLTGMCYSVGSVMRQGSSSLTRLTGQSAMTSRTWRR